MTEPHNLAHHDFFMLAPPQNFDAWAQEQFQGDAASSVNGSQQHLRTPSSSKRGKTAASSVPGSATRAHPSDITRQDNVLLSGQLGLLAQSSQHKSNAYYDEDDVLMGPTDLEFGMDEELSAEIARMDTLSQRSLSQEPSMDIEVARRHSIASEGVRSIVDDQELPSWDKSVDGAQNEDHDNHSFAQFEDARNEELPQADDLEDHSIDYQDDMQPLVLANADLFEQSLVDDIIEAALVKDTRHQRKAKIAAALKPSFTAPSAKTARKSRKRKTVKFDDEIELPQANRNQQNSQPLAAQNVNVDPQQPDEEEIDDEALFGGFERRVRQRTESLRLETVNEEDIEYGRDANQLAFDMADHLHDGDVSSAESSNTVVAEEQNHFSMEDVPAADTHDFHPEEPSFEMDQVSNESCQGPSISMMLDQAAMGVQVPDEDTRSLASSSTSEYPSVMTLLKQDSMVKFSVATEGMRKKMAAKMFFEVLTLMSKGQIEVKSNLSELLIGPVGVTVQ